MVGDTNTVKATVAIEINHFRERQPAIGIVGVDVKVTKLHTRRGRNG